MRVTLPAGFGEGEGVVHLVVVYGFHGAEEDSIRCLGLFWLRLRLFVLVGPCLLLVTSMLILVLFPALLKVFLLVSLWI